MNIKKISNKICIALLAACLMIGMISMVAAADDSEVVTVPTEALIYNTSGTGVTVYGISAT